MLFRSGGDSLGRVLAQAAQVEPAPPPPEGVSKNSREYLESEEYRSWAARTELPAKIAGNFMLGYQEGLEIKNDLYNGQDLFGMGHSYLRNWAGAILAPHIAGIAESLELSDEEEAAEGEIPPAFSLRDPQGKYGLRDRKSVV